MFPPPRPRAIVLEVREDNQAALALYSAAGFEALGVRPKYYRDGIYLDPLGRTTDML